MISNIDQLKNFIMWCKDQKIKKMNIGDISFEVSELDFLPEESSNSNDLNSKHNVNPYNSDTLADTAEESSDWRNDPDLFHSSNT